MNWSAGWTRAGRPYYWLGGDIPQSHLEEGTDAHAVANGRISVTPIHLDLTNHRLLEVMRGGTCRDALAPLSSAKYGKHGTKRFQSEENLSSGADFRGRQLSTERGREGRAGRRQRRGQDDDPARSSPAMEEPDTGGGAGRARARRAPGLFAAGGAGLRRAAGRPRPWRPRRRSGTPCWTRWARSATCNAR